MVFTAGGGKSPLPYRKFVVALSQKHFAYLGVTFFLGH